MSAIVTGIAPGSASSTRLRELAAAAQRGLQRVFGGEDVLLTPREAELTFSGMPGFETTWEDATAAELRQPDFPCAHFLVELSHVDARFTLLRVSADEEGAYVGAYLRDIRGRWVAGDILLLRPDGTVQADSLLCEEG